MDSNIPVQVSNLTSIISISNGGGHSLAVKNDGTLLSWGFNYKGELGNGTTTNSNIPIQVSSISNVTAIAAGMWFSLAQKNDGTVWAWGSANNSNIPMQVVDLCQTATITKEISSAKAEMNVFPNPALNIFTISYSSPGSSLPLTLSVSNPTGQIIYTVKENQPSGAFQKEIDLSGQPSGIYLIEVITGIQRSTKNIILR